ncbi:MAG: 2,4-dihydroxyhept-2-ene-1,7-dioic acid aldolase [Planctomycetaceae bacterium]|nr:2,4-dihydroxyhept-2-ene-1,7-dioic acid aldolase [Planctomycetaceae bacterium]
MHNLRQRLREHELLMGTMITLSSPAVTEMLSQMDFDWFFVDGEHGPLETTEMMGILQAAEPEVPCMVRVPVADEVWIKKFLDCGASGIIAPQVNSPELAAQVVSWTRYAPEGVRGVGLARAHGYGLSFADYVERANDEIACVIQVEHIDAVNCVEETVQIAGVDCILLGPYDLSASMGKMGQVNDPEVVAAIEHVTKVCQAAGMPLGYFGVSAADIKPYIDQGYTLVVAATDTIFLASGAQHFLKSLNSE